MLKKLRLKFICITMSIVTVMLVVIFGTVLHFAARGMEQQSLGMLGQAAAGPGLPGRPGEQVMMPHFVLQEGPGGALLIRGDSQFDLSDQEQVRRIWEEANASQEMFGTLSEYDLRFFKSMGPIGNSILFTDISAERQTMTDLALSCLFIGLGSFGVFLIISILLARWAIKPVERAWQEQRQFVSDASHELKTPLTVILTNAEMLAEAPDSERADQFIGSIRIMSQQMRFLVESLLELARVDSGAAKATFNRLNWSDAVSDRVLPFEAVFFEAGLTLDTDIQPDIWVKGSQGHLEQVVEILLDNARKYAEPGSCVRLRLQSHGSRECLLTVENAAPHLEAQELKNIFKRFYRVDKVRTLSDSYGLGLPIAKAIVEDHRGKISAKSEGNSVTFCVTLPIVP